MGRDQARRGMRGMKDRKGIEESLSGDEGLDRVEGRMPVLEALKSGREFRRIVVAQGARGQAVAEVMSIARARGIRVDEVPRPALDAMASGDVHQGIIGFISPVGYVELDDVVTEVRGRGEDPFIVILDEIEDPHNLGAIIRTSNCFGVHCVVIGERRSAGITPAVAKASAGAVFHTPIARAGNISAAIDRLKEQGIWVAGTDAAGDTDLGEHDFSGPLALVIGSEGKGLRRLVREKCDFLVRIPMMGEVTSLNASVAAGILIYEAFRARMPKVARRKPPQPSLT